jgi:hypothetical protein
MHVWNPYTMYASKSGTSAANIKKGKENRFLGNKKVKKIDF